MTKLVITGGTGSLGRAVASLVLEDNTKLLMGARISKIAVLSRNETQQYQMKRDFGDDIECIIGDVRDFESLYRAFDQDCYVLHAAAIKHIDIAERNPDEAIKTNVGGAVNVANAALRKNVAKVVAISTDKACNPNSTYGTTKLLAEKIFSSANQYESTIFSNARFGNLLGSNGSVFHLWKKLARMNQPLPVTDPTMTRYFLDVRSAAEFIRDLFGIQQGGETYIPHLNSFLIDEIATYIQPNMDKNYIGLRLGEKLHEELLNESEFLHAKSDGNIITIEPTDPTWAYKRIATNAKIENRFNSIFYTSIMSDTEANGSYSLSTRKLRDFLDNLPDE
jgi:UDP-N-acetylglucosamine 4,6-dehydratase/5-epimerase